MSSSATDTRRYAAQRRSTTNRGVLIVGLLFAQRLSSLLATWAAAAGPQRRFLSSTRPTGEAVPGSCCGYRGMPPMELEREQGAHEPFARTEVRAQVRDLGGRLEHVVAQYNRLARELAGDEATPSNFAGSLHLVNREIGHATQYLQELLVQQNEARRKRVHASTQEVGRGRRESREVPALRAVPALRDVDRTSVVKPFIPARHRPRVPLMTDSTRVAAAQ
jgi:hypothetical protein